MLQLVFGASMQMQKLNFRVLTRKKVMQIFANSHVMALVTIIKTFSGSVRRQKMDILLERMKKLVAFILIQKMFGV